MSPTSRIIFAAGLSLVAFSFLPSCSTQEIKLDGAGKYFDLYSDPTDTAQARFALSMTSDAGTSEEQQQLVSLRNPRLNLKIDGRWAAIVQADGSRNPAQLYPAGIGSWSMWMTAGSHVFELVDSDGKTVFQTPAYDVRVDQGNHLVVFGTADSRRHRFFSYGFDVPAGMVRYNVMNLVPTGEMMQVVKCDAPGSTNCATSVSDPIAYGDVAIGDVAAELFALSYRIIPATAGETVMPPSTIGIDLLATQIDGGMNPLVFAAAPRIVESGVVTVRLY